MQMKISFLLFSFLCIFIAVESLPAPTDARAWYDSLGGPNWKNKFGWDDPSNTDVSTWYGVSDGNLNLEDNNLIGNLPTSASAWGFPNVILSNNNGITGGFPTSWNSMFNVYSFNCDRCSLTSAPSSYPPNLNWISVENNKIVSTLNPFFTSLPSTIQGFSASGNRISGAIDDPVFVMALTLMKDSISQFYCDNCLLTGSMSNWPALSQVTYLHMQNNSIQGPVPAWLWTSSTAVHIVLSLNQLSSLPAVALNTPNLVALDLANNPLGKLHNLPEPSSCSQTISYYLVSDCGFTGNISKAFSKLSFPKLLIFDISLNSLTGTLPILSAPLLTQFSADQNALTGDLPPFDMPNLEYFSLSQNFLTGSLPSNLFDSSNLLTFNVSYNQIGGPFPSVWNNPNLLAFSISNNSVYGTLPSMSSLGKLYYFQAENNRLSGEIGNIPSPVMIDMSVSNNQFSSFSDSFDLSSLQYFTFASNAFQGPLPSSISRMKDLVVLGFANNNFEGSIPEINSKNLLGFDATFNNLTGTVPESFSHLPALRFLLLENNMLEGSFPELEESSNMEELRLANNLFTSLPLFTNNLKMRFFVAHNNSITGTLSKSFEKMPNLANFVVTNNSLSGTLPNFSSSLLVYVEASNNNLTGSIPLLPNCTSLTWIGLSNNRLEGSLLLQFFSGKSVDTANFQLNSLSSFLPDITSGNGVLPKNLNVSYNQFNQEFNVDPLNLNAMDIVFLDVSHNNFTGNLQFLNNTEQSVDIKRNNVGTGVIKAYSVTSKLAYFSIAYNQFTGPLAFQLSSYPSMWKAYFNNNQLSGTFSGDFGGTVDISNNFFTGELSIGSGNIMGIDASNNSFTSVSDSGSWTILVDLDVSNNMIQKIGKGIQLSTLLQTLDISSNPLVSIPTEMFKGLTQIVDLNLSNTKLNLTLPESIGDLKALENLDVSSSSFFGKIPDSFGKLAYLTNFNASYNGITGNIPASFKYSRYLETFDLSNNKLTGGIDESVGYLVSLVYFDLSNNLLNGTVYANIESLLDLRTFKASHNQLSGSLPNSFPNNLQQLDLSHNRLSGHFPQSLAQSSGLVNVDLSFNSLNGTIPKSVEKMNNLRVLRINDNQISLVNVLNPTWNETLVCEALDNPIECPIPQWMMRQCKITQCTVSSTANAEAELTLKGSVQSFDQNAFGVQLKAMLNLTEGRFQVDYVRDGGTVSLSKRQEQSPSTLVGLTFFPPPEGSTNQGSATRTRDLLLLMLEDDSSIGDFTVLKSSETLSQEKKSDKSVLSTAAIIGIAVGGGALLLIVIVIVVVAVVLSRRRKGEDNNQFELILKSDVMLQDVTIGKCIGEGHFGAVYMGTWNSTTVALKSLKGESDMNKWAEEVSLLSKLNHPNVVRLLGIYNQSDIFYMVLEFYERGSLDSFLRIPENNNRLSIPDLIFMGIEVAKGMIYLEAKGIIHRDLGTRNLLVTEADGRFCVKISDFGMSRETNFYETKDKRIPYRWAAPELIQFSQSSFKADVWSYAVCLWEIFSKGEIPFRSLTNAQVVEVVVDQKKHLEQPEKCPEDVFGLMKQCWKFEAKDRPTFQEIYNRMLKIHGALPETDRPPSVISAEGFYHDDATNQMNSMGTYQFG